MNNLNYHLIEFNERKDKFTNLVLNKNIYEGRLIAVNKKYLAMSCFFNGEINLADSSKHSKNNRYINVTILDNAKALKINMNNLRWSINCC